MSDWENIAFGDLLAEPIRNGIYKQKAFHGRGAKIVNMGELFAYPRLKNVEMKRVEITETEKKKCLLKNGDLIFARRSLTAEGAGKCSLVREVVEDTTFESSIIRARPNQEKSVPDFLYYYFNSPYGKYLLGTILRQVAVSGITGSDLMELVLKIPNAHEQNAIAAVLSSLDDKIDLLYRQNKTLEAMAATLFRQWFVEEAQEDLEVGALGEVIGIFDGQRIPLSKMERDKKKDGTLYPYYGAAQIMDHINDFIFDGEYILLGEDGTVRTDEGYPVLQYATGKFWVNNHTHVLKAKAPYSNFFLWNYLSKKNIDEIITGAVQPKINQGNLKSLAFPRFPKNLVIEFNRISEPILAKIQHNKTQIAGLVKLRDTLLPKLMSGEVRVAV